MEGCNNSKNGVTHSFIDSPTEKIIWVVIDAIIIFLILAGNILTICAIKLSKKISELLSNRYIFSLAVSDLMVGLTIPYHMSFTIVETIGNYKTTCIVRFVLIILACSSSIYNLLAIAADRYIAIVFPFHYSRHMNKQIVWAITLGGWCLSIAIAITPIFWNEWGKNHCECTLSILPEDYLNFIITPMFISIWTVMSLLYLRIWREAADHAKRLRTATQFQQKQKKTLKENKSVQMVLLILGSFSICWLPYFVTITCMRIMGTSTMTNRMYEAAFTMAVANSCINPFIYAWKSKNFRKAFICMLQCKSPTTLNQEPNFITDHVPCGKSKKNSMVLGNIDNGSIELSCGRNSRRYEDHENSDATTVTTCIS